MAGRRRNAHRSNKTAAGGKDRFDDLPDHVLELLLSFLPSQEAVQTCVLAKRWRHIWKSIPSLRFFTDKFDTYEQTNTFVNKLIELRDPTMPLHVCEMVPCDDIESWLQYAASCQVKVLKVEMPSEWHHGDISNNSIISQHLTKLVLYHVQFDLDHTLDLSRCHALEVLDMDDCQINLGDIVFAKSLRHLKLHDIGFYPGNIRTRISAAGLVTCELSDCQDLTPIFVSLPSVITAFVKIISESEEPEDDCEAYCEGFCCKHDCSVLLEGLSGATNLELICDHDCEIFSRDLKWHPTFVDLKTVLLNDWCVADNFAGLLYFLQHSPILERLTLQLSPSLKSSSKMLESYAPSENFHVSKNLKVVEIKSFKVKMIQICQIVNLLVTLGVPWETITIDEDFSYWNYFSFEQKNYGQKSQN